MRRWFVLIFLSSLAIAQSTQSPRQALLEMIHASSPAVVDKHTPNVMLKAFDQLPADEKQKRQQSMMFFSMMMAMAGNSFQTFETGPTLLVFQSPKDNTKVEITVERDDLSGDLDTMEFGIHVSKDGKTQEMPMDPRVLVDMKLENNVWKLAKIGGSASIQLDDPRVVDLIVKQVREQAARTSAFAANKGSTSTIVANPDASAMGAIASLRKLNQAEVTYAATYPQVGYTCSLTDLGGSLSGKSPDEHAAQLINPALEAGTRSGYRFEVSGCSGTSTYRILASPSQKGMDKRSYCTDQSSVIRSAAAGEDCWVSGKPIHQ